MSCVEHFGFYDSITEFPEHRHTSCELLYLHDGEIAVYCGGKVSQIKSGMIYLIPSCAAHKSEILNRNSYRRTLVFLNPWTYSRKYCSAKIQNILMGVSVKELVCAQDNFGGEALLGTIGKELGANDMFSEDVVISAVTQLLTGLIRNSSGQISFEKLPGTLVSEVQRYIQENSGSQIKIAEIADKFYISKYYLTHIFKEQTGLSPKSFLTFTRLSKAHNLLHDCDLKVSEISGICGFTSPSDMTKKFREHYGVTPVQFRKALNAESKKDIK